MQAQYPLYYFQSISKSDREYWKAYEKKSMKAIPTENALRFNNNRLRDRLCPKSIKKYVLNIIRQNLM